MKILDRREIAFDAKSVEQVIAGSLRAAQSFGLPGMLPIGVRFYPGAGKIDVLYGSPLAPRAVSISAEALGALLVSYCIRARIPMPKNAVKGVRIERDSVTLAFSLNYKEPPANLGAESTTPPAGSVTSWTWLAPSEAPTG